MRHTQVKIQRYHLGQSLKCGWAGSGSHRFYGIFDPFLVNSRQKAQIYGVGSYFTSLGLQQIVQEATHTEGRTIDQLYVTTDLNVQVDVQFKYFSDHAALQIKVTE